MESAILIFFLFMIHFFKWHHRHLYLVLTILFMACNGGLYLIQQDILSILVQFLLISISIYFYHQDSISTKVLLIGINLIITVSFLVWPTVFQSDVLILMYHLLVVVLFILKLVSKKQITWFYICLFLGMMIFSTYIGMNYLHPNVSMLLGLLLYLIALHNQYYIKNTYESDMNQYQAKMIQKHVEEVENLYEIMRGWRHDYHNHLQTLKAHLALNRTDLMKQYLNDLEQDLIDIHQLVQSNNTNLDAILNSKLSLAKAKAIDITIKASVPSQLAIPDIDLCVIIGNLLDNAIESCDLMRENEKFIRVYIGIFKEQLYLSVSNSTKEVIRKLDHEYITNKRGNHGHGLKRIDLVVNKYEGFVNRKNEPGVFVTEIMLPL
jgi:two-component system, LytTR family, sensor histidine kinase AgrC